MEKEELIELAQYIFDNYKDLIGDDTIEDKVDNPVFNVFNEDHITEELTANVLNKCEWIIFMMYNKRQEEGEMKYNDVLDKCKFIVF